MMAAREVIRLKSGMKARYSVLNNTIFLLAEMVRVHPLLVFFILLQIALSVLNPLFTIYLPKLAVDLLTSGTQAGQIIRSMLGFGLILAICMALRQCADTGKYMMLNNMRQHFRIKLFYQSLRCDYAKIESAEGQTAYERAVLALTYGDGSGTTRLIGAMIEAVAGVLCFILYSGILSSLNIWVVLFLLALSLISFFSVRSAQRYQDGLKDEEARLHKKLNYVEWTAKDVKFGKDIRLYGMADWFITLQNGILSALSTLTGKIKNRFFLAGVINAGILFFRDGVAYAYLIWAVAGGRISVGNFVFYFGAILGFSGFVEKLLDNANVLSESNRQMNDMRTFLDRTDSREPQEPACVPTGSGLSIEFRHVHFSYGESEEPVLDDFNLTIAKGEKIALVGVNGAGKTTLVKLLCGFYKPDKGEILIEGLSTDRFRKEDLLSLFSAVFQDFYIPPFSLAENVSLQTLDKTDLARVAQCIEQVGLSHKVSEYPEGLQTPMTRSIAEGMVLSGGQQQKLLMARALYRDAPILVLDEPTSALDPIAESDTYLFFHELAKEKTSIFISHRLASTRFCDRIILLGRGKALEVGSHEDLMACEGEYARMFEIQSHYYKSAGGESVEIS